MEKEIFNFDLVRFYELVYYKSKLILQAIKQVQGIRTCFLLLFHPFAFCQLFDS
jgi:hypothetical protein